MASRLEKVVAALIIGGALGGLAGGIAARFPPLTLPENETSKGLNESNQGFGVAVGILIGEVVGGTVALASD